MLEDHTDIAACQRQRLLVQRSKIDTIDFHTALCGTFQQINTADQGTFTCSRCTNHTDDLAGGNIEFYTFQSVKGAFSFAIHF